MAGFDVQHATCPNSPGHPLTFQGLPPISGSRIRPFAPELEGIIWNSGNWIFRRREALQGACDTLLEPRAGCLVKQLGPGEGTAYSSPPLSSRQSIHSRAQMGYTDRIVAIPSQPESLEAPLSSMILTEHPPHTASCAWWRWGQVPFLSLWPHILEADTEKAATTVPSVPQARHCRIARSPSSLGYRSPLRLFSHLPSPPAPQCDSQTGVLFLLHTHHSALEPWPRLFSV